MGLIDKLDEEVEKIKEEICDKYCKFPDQYGKTATGAGEWWMSFAKIVRFAAYD